MQILEISIIWVYLPEIASKCVENRDFSEILIFGIRASCEISRKLFTSLRFICNRAHVRSRRAPREFGRRSDFRNINYMGIFDRNHL